MDLKTLYIKIKYDGKGAEAGIKRMNNAFNALRKIVTFVVAGKMVKDMANFGKEISLMADRTGMSIQKLSALRNVFMSAGSGAKGFQQTIDRINSGLLGLKRGESHLAAQLAPLGINPFGKDAGQILEEIADAAKAQLSMGRSRESVLDYLTNVIGIDQATAEKLMEGREAFLAEQERLRGKVGTGDKHTEELKELNRALNELDAAWQNAKANIIGYVAPILTAIISSFTDLVHLFGENEWAGVIAGITAALAGFFGTIKSASWILGLLGIKTAATTTAGTVAGGIGKAAAGIGAGTTLLATALVALIGDCIVECYDMIKTGQIRGPLGKLFEALFGAIVEIFEDISEGLEGLWDSIKSYGKDKWEGLKEWYYNKRSEFGSAKSFYDFGNEAASENAAEKTKGLLYRPDAGFFIAYSDEPLISDENYEKPILPTNATKVEVHMENSTYYGVSSENAETFGNEVGSGLTGAVQAGVSG